MPLPLAVTIMALVAAAFGAMLPRTLPGQSPAPAPTLAWVDTLFRDHSGDQPGCRVGAARRGSRLFVRSYGLANLHPARVADSATAFGIASLAKQFTAASVVLLAQDGRITLDDDVRRWVPELRDYGRTITLRHLLTHTSGIRDFMNLLAMQRGGSPTVTDADALEAIFRQRELNFPPGTDWAYSNSGYVLLAEVVKRASGRALPEFVETRILAPLRMGHTTFTMSGAIDPRHAVGYVPTRAGWSASYFPVFTTGDGTMSSTVEDLLRWGEGLHAGRVGGLPATRTLETPGALADGTRLGYALGVEIGEHHGVRTVSHGGAGGGFRAELLRVPAHDLAVAVLCNGSTAPADQLALRIAERLLATERAAATPAVPTSPPLEPGAPDVDLGAFAGVYASLAGTVRTFITDSAGFRLRVPPGVDRVLVPLGGARLRIANTPVVFEFGDGEVRRTMPGMPVEILQRVAATHDTVTDARRVVGRYHSAELDATWELQADERGAIRVAHGSPGSPERALPVFRGAVLIPYGLLRFTTDCRGDVDGFTLSEERVRGLRFVRVGTPRARGCPPR